MLIPVFQHFTDYRPDDQIGTTRTHLLRTNKIALSFHLYGLENTDRIVSVRVVFKHRASLPHFRVTAYEMKENGFMMRLDSQVSDGGWIDLNIQDIFELHKEEKTRSKSTDYRPPLDREHRVVLELTELNSARASEKLISTLHTLNPFIAVYTYDNEVYEHLSGGSAGRQQHQQESSHMGRTVSKRQATVSTEGGNTDPFAHLRRNECQLHGVNITVQELGWVGPAYEVILPYWLNFTFCYGRCDVPVGTRNRNKYSAHAKTLKLLKPDLARAGIAPSCAPSRNPADTKSVQIILLSGNVTETTTIPLVQSCICQ